MLVLGWGIASSVIVTESVLPDRAVGFVLAFGWVTVSSVTIAEPVVPDRATS